MSLLLNHTCSTPPHLSGRGSSRELLLRITAVVAMLDKANNGVWMNCLISILFFLPGERMSLMISYPLCLRVTSVGIGKVPNQPQDSPFLLLNRAMPPPPTLSTTSRPPHTKMLPLQERDRRRISSPLSMVSSRIHPPHSKNS